MYGVIETNGLEDGLRYHREFNATRTVAWDEDGLKITRLRLLSDPGLPAWDVSYCHGVLNGENVHVELPFSQLPEPGMKAALYNHAKKSGKFINGLFAAISTLK